MKKDGEGKFQFASFIFLSVVYREPCQYLSVLVKMNQRNAHFLSQYREYVTEIF